MTEILIEFPSSKKMKEILLNLENEGNSIHRRKWAKFRKYSLFFKILKKKIDQTKLMYLVPIFN
jgi:hypothetical protein